MVRTAAFHLSSTIGLVAVKSMLVYEHLRTFPHLNDKKDTLDKLLYKLSGTLVPGEC